uniref:Uncharacterized protein n=1 Tax=Anguilla anguilla TaxID=7936 RepID=A0A0E9S7H0_ANGAN
MCVCSSSWFWIIFDKLQNVKKS